MNICLVTAPIVAEFADSVEITSEQVMEAAAEPQLGVLSLAAVLEGRGVGLRLFDVNRTYVGFKAGDCDPPDKEFAEIAAFAIAEKPADVYAFSSICSSYPLTLRIAERVKAIRRESWILLGGPQASVVDIGTLRVFPFVDFILRGEAEQTLPLLLDQLGSEQRLDQVPGLSYRREGQPRRNANAPVIVNLDALPSPAYHLTEDLRGVDRAALELGRGCPFACTFCSTNDFFRRNFRLRSPERVLSDMRMIARTYAIRHFKLVHDMFTVDRRRVAAFCEAMIASGEQFTWSCSARTDCVDQELLALMARGGCRGIFFGVETGSERMQKIIDKHLCPKRAEEVIDETERLGIHSTVALITGFPEETPEDLRQTVQIFMHSARCRKSHPQLNLLAPLADTPIYSKHRNELVLEEICSGMSRQGRTKDDQDLQLVRSCPDIFPNFYSIPTKYLERSRLIELQEFLLMGTACFRWLLTAIDQTATGILDFFLEWREFRRKIRPSLEGVNLRGYYRTQLFRMEFLSFVRSHKAANDTAVEALLVYENAIRRTDVADETTIPVGDLLPCGAHLECSDTPVRRERVVVIELGLDIQQVVDALKVQSKVASEKGLYFYVTREVSASVDRLDQVSRWMGCLLKLCNGRRRIDEIVPKLSAILDGIDKTLHPYVCMRLLEGAQSQKLIDIFRIVTVPRPVRNRSTGRRRTGTRYSDKHAHQTHPRS